MQRGEWLGNIRREACALDDVEFGVEELTGPLRTSCGVPVALGAPEETCGGGS